MKAFVIVKYFMQEADFVAKLRRRAVLLAVAKRPWLFYSTSAYPPFWGYLLPLLRGTCDGTR